MIRMDLLTAYYELRFQNDFLRAKGITFQTLFATLMSNAHPADFIPCRPWGATGDRKNDGYLKSERLLFQVYAPNELRAAQAIKKIKEDFTQAVPYWKDYFETWVFVHNSIDGLSAPIVDTLLALERDHPTIKVTAWGYNELVLRFRTLSFEARSALYGVPPTRETITMLLSASRTPAVRESLTIIIAVHNEARNIPALFKGLRAEGFTDQYRILIYDDASTDESFELLQLYSRNLPNVTCLHLSTNTQKVGAIEQMATMVDTPFILTLDADSMLTELRADALENLLQEMHQQEYDAAYFRIMPDYQNVLERLQRLDYTIFTDTLRRLLGVPVCLVGQGVIWNTQRFREVLSLHSKHYDGDDLENTVIALSQRLRLHWEREHLVLTTTPKPSLASLLKQRALSWDFGMFRVLLTKRALLLGGETGAFYKTLLWADLVAHPFRVLAIPMLLATILFRYLGEGVAKKATREIIFQSFRFSFTIGSRAILGILIASVLTAAVCVRGRPLSVLKWVAVNLLYLSSPFVFLLYYPLVHATNVGAEDVFGAAVHWFGLGLFLTYTWWALITLVLVSLSSLRGRAKRELLPVVLLAPAYYFVLLLVGKTGGILKLFKELLIRRQRRTGFPSPDRRRSKGA
jgi:cellulose synthase/poly-beta-1,6-N-acetylglucosamine synthase-like glycosyltransferase